MIASSYIFQSPTNRQNKPLKLIILQNLHNRAIIIHYYIRIVNNKMYT